MSGISIPGDRTTRAMARGYCLNPACLNASADDRFEFNVEDDLFACPKCGNNSPPGVGLLVLVHFLVPHERGPIMGATQRFALACDNARAYLATTTNLEAASGLLSAVNCPECLKAVDAAKQLLKPKG